MRENLRAKFENKRASIGRGELISWIVMMIVLAPFILFAVPQLVGAKDAYVVRSGSMEPAIPTGSVIWASGIKPEKVQPDDIITYDSGETVSGDKAYTTHRVIEVRQVDGNYQYKTKGDNNEDPDPGWVSEDRLVAKHMFTVPMLGYLLNWLGTTQSIIAFIVIPATILIFYELYSIGKEVYGMKKEGKDRDLLETVAIGIAALIFLASVEMFTGIGASMLPAETSLQFGPMAFGTAVLISLVASMLLLKFL